VKKIITQSFGIFGLFCIVIAALVFSATHDSVPERLQFVSAIFACMLLFSFGANILGMMYDVCELLLFMWKKRRSRITG